MNNQLIDGFKYRNDHLIQAAWLSSFSHIIKKNCLRDSVVYIYNIQGRKYLPQLCKNVMLSDHLIENNIDDIYAKNHEDMVSDILKNNQIDHLGQYISNLIAQYMNGILVENDIPPLINFLILLNFRNNTMLVDNALRLLNNPDEYIDKILQDPILKNYIDSKFINSFNVNNDLDLLFLSNCLLKVRFDGLKEKISLKHDDLTFRLCKIQKRNKLGKKIDGIMIMGENPVFRINSFKSEEIIYLKNYAIQYTQDETLINKYWDIFSEAFIVPLSWNDILMLCEKSLVESINHDNYTKLMDCMVFLYEHHQIFSCKKELIINPKIYGDNDVKLFIDDLVYKINQNNSDISKINEINRKFRKVVK